MFVVRSCCHDFNSNERCRMRRDERIHIQENIIKKLNRNWLMHFNVLNSNWKELFWFLFWQITASGSEQERATHTCQDLPFDNQHSCFTFCQSRNVMCGHVRVLRYVLLSFHFVRPPTWIFSSSSQTFWHHSNRRMRWTGEWHWMAIKTQRNQKQVKIRRMKKRDREQSKMKCDKEKRKNIVAKQLNNIEWQMIEKATYIEVNLHSYSVDGCAIRSVLSSLLRFLVFIYFLLFSFFP